MQKVDYLHLSDVYVNFDFVLKYCKTSEMMDWEAL